MLQKLSYRVAGRDRGLRLDQYLARAVPEQSGVALSRREARRRIAAGAAYVDGRRVKIASRLLRPGQKVALYLDPSGSEAPRSDPGDGGDFDLKALILYEDEDLLAVDKPSGLPVQATLDDDLRHLLAQVRRYLAAGPDGHEPTLPHRLDRGTSGVQLVAKTRRASAGLAEAFRRRQVEKTYLALCAAGDRPPPERWTATEGLELRSQGPGRPRRAAVVEEGGRDAETRFEVCERLAGAVLVRAEPRTGRTHQIRVHLAHAGHPVLGDRLYGPPEPAVRAPRLMLHAAELACEHPVSGEPLRIESPLPDDFRRWIANARRTSPPPSPYSPA